MVSKKIDGRGGHVSMGGVEAMETEPTNSTLIV